MAIMDRPKKDNIDEIEMDIKSPAHLEEGDNVSQENSEMSGIIGWINSRYNKANDGRQTDEDRWLRSYRNYRGIYGPEVQFTETEKSKAFIKITKTKVLAAYNQVVDVLFAGGKFPVGVEAPSTSVGDVVDAVHFEAQADPEVTMQPSSTPKGQANTTRKSLIDRVGPLQSELERVEKDLVEGVGISPTALTYEPIKKAAQKMERMIYDQLEECEASKHLRSVAFEMSLFGTGIIKGPFAHDKEYPRWNETGDYDPEFRVIPKVEHVSIWDFYPDPDARSMNDAEFTIQRHRMSRSQLRQLKNRPHFRKESIELAIEIGEDYEKEYWESALEDNSSVGGDVDRFKVLEYWGVIDSSLAEEADIDIPKEYKDRDQIQINAWICNGQILRLVLNPFSPSRIPYCAVPYEVNPYSFFGVGLAENMEDTQDIMNGFMRMAVDNAALSSNLLIEIDETNLVPGQNLSIHPGKIFRRQAGAPGQAIFGTKFPNVTNECLMMFDKARQLSDESTGMPSYAHGMTGVQGVGRTASGMSMLLSAASQNIKSVVRNVDDYLLTPVGKSLFAFNMQFNFDEEMTKGALNVVARGTESLMRNEVRSQRLLSFMNQTANPMMAPFIKYDYILRELSASMDLDEDKILNDPREAAIQAKMMAEIASLMPQEGPVPPQMAPEDPTGTGGGQIAPGNAPPPETAGNTNGQNAEAAPTPPPDQTV